MTDYSSQRRTRPNNVADPSGYPTHHSYYTALSRSSSAGGTILLSPVDPIKITGGISEWLRQEFRELELLDDITTSCYEGVLPAFISCHRREVLLNQFLQLKGSLYMPPKVHKSIAWSGSDLLSQLSTVDNIVLDNYMDASGIAPEGTKKGSKKRKRGPMLVPETSGKKQQTIGNNSVTEGPIGLRWDAKTASCAYDAFFTVLHHIWTECVDETYMMLSQYNNFWNDLRRDFVQCQQRAEDLMRCRMSHCNPSKER